eukprot:TRINITY_DN16167_c0_g1_i1.p1 TRINITY_DN16167_c0_g1~~TRINITY_DN16167_c0_g1_i1.p1  ORF type:complete len:795 (+),score=161.88 TRINITY_DN16167_c0_g1_i1:34-2418(+)
MRRAWLLLAVLLATRSLCVPVGTGREMYSALVTVAARRRGAGALASANVPVPDGSIAVSLTDSALDKDGVYMYVSGHAADQPDVSEFMLRGTPAELSGFLAFRARGVAYRYTTDGHGVVHAEEASLGDVLPECGLEEEGDAEAHRAAGGLEMHKHDSEFDPAVYDMRRLQSRPSARKVMYMNFSELFEEEGVSDEMTHWAGLGAGMRWTNKDHDSRPFFFHVWQVVASGLSMYDVNVATDVNSFRKADLKDRGMLCFVNATGRSYAQVNVFGAQPEGRCRGKTFLGGSGRSTGRVALHEAGHLLGLGHDAVILPDGEKGMYFRGFEEFKWAPVMGSHKSVHMWRQDGLQQWSLGEYVNATNYEDDLALIGRHLPRLEDDILGTTPLRIDAPPNVTADANTAHIHDRTDEDRWWFYVTKGGGAVDLAIDRVGGRQGMLDVDATLTDNAGRVLAHSNPTAERDARINVTLPSYGYYTLIVRGGAEGTPEEGFSSYSSLGEYKISGSIAHVARPQDAPRYGAHWGLASFMLLVVCAVLGGTFVVIHRPEWLLVKGVGNSAPAVDPAAADPAPKDAEAPGASPPPPAPAIPEFVARSVLHLTTAAGVVLERIVFLSDGRVRTMGRPDAGSWRMCGPVLQWAPHAGAVVAIGEVHGLPALLPPVPSAFCPEDACVSVVPRGPPGHEFSFSLMPTSADDPQHRCLVPEDASEAPPGPSPEATFNAVQGPGTWDAFLRWAAAEMNLCTPSAFERLSDVQLAAAIAVFLAPETPQDTVAQCARELRAWAYGHRSGTPSPVCF